MTLNKWTKVGLAGKFSPRRPINFDYTLEVFIENNGLVRYRAVNSINDAKVPLSGNHDKYINNFVQFDNNPENRFSSTVYPMMGQPYVLSTELPSWFYVMLYK